MPGYIAPENLRTRAIRDSAPDSSDHHLEMTTIMIPTTSPRPLLQCPAVVVRMAGPRCPRR
eukprot:2757051-Rhodomonas_salina.1